MAQGLHRCDHDEDFFPGCARIPRARRHDRPRRAILCRRQAESVIGILLVEGIRRDVMKQDRNA